MHKRADGGAVLRLRTTPQTKWIVKGFVVRNPHTYPIWIAQITQSHRDNPKEIQECFPEPLSSSSRGHLIDTIAEGLRLIDQGDDPIKERSKTR